MQAMGQAKQPRFLKAKVFDNVSTAMTFDPPTEEL
jgi:hypothetical protein